MITPFLQDDALLASVNARAGARDGQLRLWWLGQSGFLLQFDGEHILLDPYLSDSLTRKYAGTAKPHLRMTARVIAPERLDFIDAVTASHAHTDHLDPETLRPLASVNPKLRLLCPHASRAEAVRRSALPETAVLGLDAGEHTRCGQFGFWAVPAAHEQLEQDEAGHHRYLGYVVRAGPWTVYHSGDTVRYEGMAERLRPCRIDVALLPINGRSPERQVAGNLTGPEAAELAKAIGARVAIPCHYEMFEFNTASPEGFVRAARESGQAVRVLRAGEGWSPGGRRGALE